MGVEWERHIFIAWVLSLVVPVISLGKCCKLSSWSLESTELLEASSHVTSQDMGLSQNIKLLNQSYMKFKSTFQRTVPGETSAYFIWVNMFVVKHGQCLSACLFLLTSFLWEKMWNCIYFSNAFRRNVTQSQHFSNNVKECRWKNSLNKEKAYCVP